LSCMRGLASDVGSQPVFRRPYLFVFQEDHRHSASLIRLLQRWAPIVQYTMMRSILITNPSMEVKAPMKWSLSPTCGGYLLKRESSLLHVERRDGQCMRLDIVFRQFLRDVRQDERLHVISLGGLGDQFNLAPSARACQWHFK